MVPGPRRLMAALCCGAKLRFIIITTSMQTKLGQLKLDRILWVLISLMLGAPLYTYYMAVTYHEEKPYPHTTVTDTATHYPQDIVFRLIMLINASFLGFVFYAVFRWAEWEAQRVGYHRPPWYQFYLAEVSIFCYCITIGTIDGKGTGDLHTKNAIMFFVLWLITILNMTAYFTRLRGWDTSVMSWGSLKLKQALALYVGGVWAWCYYHILNGTAAAPNKQDIYVVIVEWNSVFINLLWVLSFVLEWKKFVICISPKPQAITV